MATLARILALHVKAQEVRGIPLVPDFIGGSDSSVYVELGTAGRFSLGPVFSSLPSAAPPLPC